MNQELKNKITNRQEDNRKILEILSKAVEQCPQQRFIQLLWNLGLITRSPENAYQIEDKFYEEPADTLVRVQDCLTRFF